MNLKPSGKRLVIKAVEAEEKTASGIVLPSSAKEQPQFAEVVAIGDKIANSETKGGFLNIGDRVIYSKYAGTEVKLEGEEFIIINFDDILAKIEG